jgi:hypothetical protein
VIDSLRINPRGQDIGVDSLATELVIDRRLAHGVTPYGRVHGDMHMGVDRLWMFRTVSLGDGQVPGEGDGQRQ